MIPKLEACITAIEGGVSRAHLIDGRRSPDNVGRGIGQRSSILSDHELELFAI